MVFCAVEISIVSLVMGNSESTREVSIVNATIDLMKNEWSQNIPSEYKDNHIVAKRLRELVDKYDNR